MADTRKSKTDDAFVCVGMITAPHGVRGAVRVKSYTVDPDNLVGYGPLFDAKGQAKFKLSPGRPCRKRKTKTNSILPILSA